MFEDKKVLTGVKPTGTPHLGNYLGAIKPAIRLGHQALDAGGKHYMFIADYHAINAEKDPAVLKRSPASTWQPASTLPVRFSIVSRTLRKFRKSPPSCMPIRQKAL